MRNDLTYVTSLSGDVTWEIIELLVKPKLLGRRPTVERIIPTGVKRWLKG
jgi:hypothetical protein